MWFHLLLFHLQILLMKDKSAIPYPVNDKRTINAWAMFDWANSSYALVISVAIFPMYFNNVMVEGNFEFLGLPVNRSALFSYSLSFAYLIIGALLPLLTGIADSTGAFLVLYLQ